MIKYAPTFGIASLSLFYTLAFASGNSIEEVTQENVTRILEHQQPIVIDISTTECEPCQRMKPIFNFAAKELGSSYLFVQVNFDNFSNLTQFLGNFTVEAFPTLIIIKNKQIVGSIIGLCTPDQLKERIEDIVNPEKLSTLDRSTLKKKFFHALLSGTVQDVHRLLKAGVNPNEPLESDSDLEGSQAPQIKPLTFLIYNISSIQQALQKFKAIFDAIADRSTLTIEALIEKEIQLTKENLNRQERMLELVRNTAKYHQEKQS